MAATVSFTCPECKAQLKGPAELQGKKGRCKRCGHTFVLKASAPAKAPTQPRPPTTTKTPPPAGKGKPAAPAAKTPSKTPASPSPQPKKPDESDHGPGTYGWLDDGKTDWSESAGAQESKDNPGGVVYHHQDRNPYGVTELDLAPRCPHCAKELESEDAVICLHCGYNTQTRQHGATVRTYANTSGDQFKWLLPGILCVVGILAMIGAICYLWLGLPDPNNEKIKEEWWKEFIRPAQVWGSILAGFFIVGFGRFAVLRLVLYPTPPEMEKK
jgi:DNA-directed RNA polymerase subunit RPC12/RpoP